MRKQAAIFAVVVLAALRAGSCAAQGVAADLRCSAPDLGEAPSKAEFRAATKNAPRLFKAIQRDDLRALKRGLAQGDDPNACVVGASLVAHAAVTGDIRLVDGLLRAGASLDRPLNADGETVLLHAVGEGELMALQLLDRGANPGATRRDGITVLHLAAALPVHPNSARAREQIDFFNAVLSRGLGTSVQMTDGATPLVIATLVGNVPLTRWLLSRGADPNLRGGLGNTVIQQAAADDRKDIANLLREFALPPTVDGQSVVQLIEQGRTAELAQLLSHLPAEGASFRARQALLVAAILARNLDAVGVLARWGADPNAVFEVPDGFDSSAVTPLLFAIGQGADGKMIEQLIKAGANPDRYVPVIQSERPLEYALMSDDLVAADALLRNGADPNLVNPRHGWTPLMVAAERVKSPDEPWFRLIENLLKVGASVDTSDADGATALHISAAKGNARLVKCLLEHGANPVARDNNGRTPLDLARKEKAKPVIALLAGLSSATR
jgi:ankyrin repeat protein